MGELSVKDIVDLWGSCAEERGGTFEMIRLEMADKLGIVDYPQDSFYDKFRRNPPRSTNYRIDELLALVGAYKKFVPQCVSAHHAIRLFHAARMTINDFQRLKVLFDDTEFNAEWNAYLDEHNLRLRGERPTLPVQTPLESERWIVGRDAESAAFEQFLQPRYPATVYAIYGPGGIGKSVLAEKFQQTARRKGVPLAFVNGTVVQSPSLMMAGIAFGFSENPALADSFKKFTTEYERYYTVQAWMRVPGGVDTLYDVFGKLQNPDQLRAVLPTNAALQDDLMSLFANRFTLERYLNGAERSLAHQLGEALGAASAMSAQPLSLVIDTYENIQGMDDWFVRELLPKLRRTVRVTILGRNALTQVNFDWKELGSQLEQKPLQELSETDTRTYLHHYGLTDHTRASLIYEYTKGYPLLLVLVRDLARELGGWEHLGALDSRGDRYQIAADLLDRLLREERVQEVRTFLEKGVVVDWFNPEVVSVVLDVSFDEGHKIYDKLRRHSFVERHPEGLKFHDVIANILRDRLSETEKAFLKDRVRRYFHDQSGDYGR